MRFRAGTIGVFLGALLGCLMSLLLSVVAAHQHLSISWSSIWLNTIANGMAVGFLAGFLRGPVKAGAEISPPSASGRRYLAALFFCPQLGALIGGGLAAGAQLVLQVQTDLVLALAQNPAQAWAVMRNQGIGDLAGRVILGIIGGFFGGGLIGGVLPALNVCDDESADLLGDLLEARKETPLKKPAAPTSDPAELERMADLNALPPLIATADKQAHLPKKALTEVLVPLDTDTQALNELLKTAFTMIENKAYDQAVKVLEPARAAYPDVLSVAINLAVAYEEIRRFTEADAEYKRAIALDPNNFLSHYNYGCFLRGRHDLDGAIREFREAGELNPAYAAAWGNLAQLVDDPQEAVTYLKKALAAEPASKQYQQGLELLREVEAGRADFVEGVLITAEAAMARNDSQNVQLFLARLGRQVLQPNQSARANALEAELLRQQDDLPGSIRLLRLAVESNPEMTSYWNTLSAREVLLAQQQMQSLERNGRLAELDEEPLQLFAQAIEHAQAAIRIADYAMPNQNAALAHLHRGELTEAQRRATTARDLAKKALAGRHECNGCLMQGKILMECRSCLAKAEGTLRDIRLASGDYSI